MSENQDGEKMTFKPPKYIALSMDEAVRLIICVILDIAEYIVPVLLSPITGDVLDLVGIGAGIIIFRWIGLVSLLEFLPGADIFPIFIITWIIWYYFKREGEKDKEERIKEEWK